MNQWLKIRPALLSQPAIELVVLAQRADGLYKRTLACHLTNIEDGFTANRLSSMLDYLANQHLYKVDEREAEVELNYSYVGAVQ